MTDHRLDISEGPEINDAVGAPVLVRKTYRVTAKAENGLFKNSKTYKPGETLELDEKTAKGFLELGELELVDDGGQDA